MILLEFDLVGFLGRFHPIVVHLPIGFLLLGILLEYLTRKSGLELGKAKSWIFLAGALAAVLAAGLGWMLASDGGYGENTLFWHRWLGIGVAVVAVLLWLVSTGRFTLSSTIYKLSLLVLIGLLVVTGHLGGNLTHGANYLLEYAPEPMAKLLGSAPPAAIEISADPDSVVVFTDLIQPMLENRCVQCHNSEKKKGDLDLSTPEAILAGGDDGEVIQPGNAQESELFNRITLPQDHKKFMPTDGNTPLSYHQVRLISWWIDAGADFEATVLATGVPPDIKFLLAQNYQLDSDPKPYVERAQVTAAPDDQLIKLQEAGFYAQPIASNNNFIEVKKKKSAELQKESLSLIGNVSRQVTWLHLSEAGLSDEDLSFLGELENLTLLRLDNNAITDRGVKYLEGLPHLESLNLYGTQVSGEILESLKTLPELKKVFLWQTKVSPQEVSAIREALPHLEVDAGMELSSN